MANQQTNYSNIQDSYNDYLERASVISSGNSVIPTSSNGETSSGGSASTGSTGTGAPASAETPTTTPSSVTGSSLADLYIESFIKSRNYQPKVSGFLFDGRTGYIEAMDIYIKGSIVGGSLNIPDKTTANSFHVDTSGNTWWGSNVADGYAAANAYVLKTGVAMFKSGTVGGWTLGATTLTGTGVTLSSAGDAYLAIGTTPPTGVATGTGIFINKTGLFGLNANTQNFKIDATNGNITAIAGTVGGWTLSTTALSTGTFDTLNTMYFGSSGLSLSNVFKVTAAGALTAASATITGAITATSGTIGSFTIGTYLYTGTKTVYNDTNAGVHLGSDGIGIANNLFTVSAAGVITAVSGTIGGCALGTTSIGSTTFVSGPLGYGWNMSNTGTAEFQNVSIRGVIRTSVFEKDTISAVNGIVLVSKADVLSVDVVAIDTNNITISGETSFVANEILRLKDGTNDEWLLVTVVNPSNNYTVTRGYGSSTPVLWKKGTAVVSMGVGTGTKTGFVLLDSSSVNSPYIDVYGRNSNTYNDYTLHGRFGWLKGITDADVGLNTTDVWGLYTDNAYLKGVIVANTGYIGGTTGWTIAAGSISSVNGGNTTVLASGGTNALIAGTTGAPTVSISHAGVLTASGVTISGALTATSGYIGGTTNGIQINSDGIEIIGTGYIKTNTSPNARLELLKTSGAFTSALVGYDSTNYNFFKLSCDGGNPSFRLSSNSNTIPLAHFISGTSPSSTDIDGIVEIFSATGIASNALKIYTSGATAKTNKAAFFVKNEATYGAGFRVEKGENNNEPGFISKGNALYGDAYKVKCTDIDTTHGDSSINNLGYTQFPAYYHYSEFDENISEDTALAFSVIAKAYWDGGGTNGTQTLIDGNYEATYIELSTTATANSTSYLEFNRGTFTVGLKPSCEFRVRISNATNTAVRIGFRYSDTYYLYFLFDTAVSATNIYAESNNNGSVTTIDTTLDISTTIWYTFRIFYTNSVAYFFINNNLVATITTNIPIGARWKTYFYINNKDQAEEKILYIDYIKMWQGRDDTTGLTS